MEVATIRAKEQGQAWRCRQIWVGASSRRDRPWRRGSRSSRGNRRRARNVRHGPGTQFGAWYVPPCHYEDSEALCGTPDSCIGKSWCASRVTPVRILLIDYFCVGGMTQKLYEVRPYFPQGNRDEYLIRVFIACNALWQQNLDAAKKKMGWHGGDSAGRKRQYL